MKLYEKEELHLSLDYKFESAREKEIFNRKVEKLSKEINAKKVDILNKPNHRRSELNSLEANNLVSFINSPLSSFVLKFKSKDK